MADIQIACPRCGYKTTISEYAAPEAAVCSFCGTKLAKPEAAKPKGKLTVRENAGSLAQPQAQPAGADQPPQEWRFLKYVGSMRQKEKSKKRSGHFIASWILFIVLGGTMAMLRYGKVLPPHYLKYGDEYGPYAILAFYVVAILMAFKDSVFHGILSLLVPLYPFYYLFAVSDNFYARAIVGALLIGVGEHSFQFYREKIIGVIDFVDFWIRSGGERAKRF